MRTVNSVSTFSASSVIDNQLERISSYDGLHILPHIRQCVSKQQQNSVKILEEAKEESRFSVMRKSECCSHIILAQGFNLVIESELHSNLLSLNTIKCIHKKAKA